MVFSSTIFLFIFLPLTIIFYYSPLCKSVQIKNLWLFFVSLFFYAWGEPIYIGIMLLSIIVNHFLGILAEKYAKTIKGKIIVLVTCFFNLGILFIFKYLSWILRDLIHFDISKSILGSIVLPIGISFYTFQALSYVIDVYRGGDKAQRNILNTGLYISFFPQLIAGPIVRYKTISLQLIERKHNFALFSQGVRRFIIGLSKKMLLANNVAPLVYHAFSLDGFERTVLMSWIGILAFMIQIYFDFSGYSDMAIGLGKMFGFEFFENFDYPYVSKSITEYWRRWHISLGQWFRDYLYYPLSTGLAVSIRRKIMGIVGRNASGIISNTIVLFIVWFATGLWHGANMTFILWGLLQFIFIIREQYIKIEKKNIIISIVAFISTFMRILLTKVLFRADTLSQAMSYYASMFHLSGNKLIDETSLYFFGQYKILLFFGLLFCFPIMEKLGEHFDKSEKASNIYYFIKTILLAFLFILDIAYVLGDGYNPFIYFNF